VVGDAVFFVAPLGFTGNEQFRPLVKMLNACGFFVRFSDDQDRPTFLEDRIPKRYRFRLFQFLQPGEALGVYAQSQGTSWFANDAENHAYPMVDNVIGLVLRANYPSASGEETVYVYDSRDDGGRPKDPPPTFHQLPTSIRLVMVVIDEDSARRLAATYGPNEPPIGPDQGTRFTDPSMFERDLEEWTDQLEGLKVEYRVLTADVPIRGAKWSSN
jgi:uncharacterized protein (TIGR02599 family)